VRGARVAAPQLTETVEVVSGSTTVLAATSDQRQLTLRYRKKSP